MALTLKTKTGHLLLNRTCREAAEAISAGDVRCIINGARGGAFCTSDAAALRRALYERCPAGSLAGHGKRRRRRRRGRA